MFDRICEALKFDHFNGSSSQRFRAARVLVKKYLTRAESIGGGTPTCLSPHMGTALYIPNMVGAVLRSCLCHCAAFCGRRAVRPDLIKYV